MKSHERKSACCSGRAAGDRAPERRAHASTDGVRTAVLLLWSSNVCWLVSVGASGAILVLGHRRQLRSLLLHPGAAVPGVRTDASGRLASPT